MPCHLKDLWVLGAVYCRYYSALSWLLSGPAAPQSSLGEKGFCCGLHFVPPPKICPSPNCPALSHASKWDLIWKEHLCRSNQVKTRSYASQVGPILTQYDWYPDKKREIWTDTQREDGVNTYGPEETRAETGTMQAQANGHRGSPATAEARIRRGRTLPRESTARGHLDLGSRAS